MSLRLLFKAEASILFAVAIVCIATWNCVETHSDDNEFDHIVGGKAAQVSNYQFLAVLLRNGDSFCGGSLVTPNHILTAAHCVDYLKPSDFASLKVLLNTSSINPEDAGTVRRNVKKIVFHKNYNSETSLNDIAVVTLDSPVNNIKPIQLPRIGSTLSYAGMWGVIIGFGRTQQTMADEESSGLGSNTLMESSVQVISNTNCSAMYVDTKISASMLCAYAPGTDTCQGDSGGPLIVDGVQVGIVSWGYGCADPSYAGVYTRLTFFYTWIKTNLV